MAYARLETYINDHVAGATAGVNLAQTLSMGIEGKICMWRSLTTVADGHPALGSLDLDNLVARGEDQRADRGEAAADRPAGARPHRQRLTAVSAAVAAR